MIEETLAKIEAALNEARVADPKNKAELIALLERLKLEVSSETRSQDILGAVGAEIKDAAIGFEATHPKLAAIVSDISLMLAKIGI